MKLPLRFVSLCFLLLAASPLPAFGAPKGSAKPDKAPMSDGSAVGMLALLGLVAIGGGGVLVMRMRSGRKGGKGDGRAPEPILAQRKYDWELRLTPEQENAMLQGVQAYRDGGHSLYLSHSDGLITFYEPRMLVSLHRLTDAFLSAGPAAMTDPPGVVRNILGGLTTHESPGSLHLQKGWYAAPIDGLDHVKFTNLCYDALTRPKPYIEGTQGSSADENSGSMTLNVEVGGPMNTFCVDLRRVLLATHEARRARPTEPLIDLVRPVLQAMSRGAMPGAMWTRGGASGAEVDVVTRVVATSQARAA